MQAVRTGETVLHCRADGHLPCIEQPRACATLLSGFHEETGHV